MNPPQFVFSAVIWDGLSRIDLGLCHLSGMAHKQFTREAEEDGDLWCKEAVKRREREMGIPESDCNGFMEDVFVKDAVIVDLCEQSPQVDFYLQHPLQGQKEPGTKASKGAKGKKDEKQEAAKEGTTPSENGENKAEEAQKTESVGDKNE
ncbi:hypothetical protein BTVI_138615 [Pitangus sulphuratus]|nr:hypothetical protein BTVI_138615 [Pitangus sulphuratus]